MTTDTKTRTHEHEEYETLTKIGETLVKEYIKGDRKGMLGEANYLHSFRVRDMVSSCHHWDYPNYDLFLAALLHDIVEDGGVSFEELATIGFSERTIELIQLCSHQMDIKNNTERWTLMVAKLIEAKDEDAWSIKLADLADNLTQSKGLSLENRRFMIEVKAPLLLRLTSSGYNAYFKLKTEMEKQRAELTKQWRYVVTLWTEEFDYDGVLNTFKVLGNFEDRGDASVCAMAEMEEFVRNRLDVNTDWNPVLRDAETRPAFKGPNKLNKVVLSRSASRKDTTGFDSLYGFIEVIELPFDAEIGERLFNLKDCGFEIHDFFDTKTKEKKNQLFKLKRDRTAPTQCHLWQKDELQDGDLDNTFDVVKTYSEDSHFSRRLVKCKQCGQLYLKEFHEEVDWVDGEDPQYVTYIPVQNEQEAEVVNQVGLWEFQTFTPRINRDWPKGEPRKIYWIGK